MRCRSASYVKPAHRSTYRRARKRAPRIILAEAEPPTLPPCEPPGCCRDRPRPSSWWTMTPKYGTRFASSSSTWAMKPASNRPSRPGHRPAAGGAPRSADAGYLGPGGADIFPSAPSHAAAGAFDILAKPFDMPTLQSLVGAAFSQPSHPLGSCRSGRSSWHLRTCHTGEELPVRRTTRHELEVTAGRGAAQQRRRGACQRSDASLQRNVATYFGQLFLARSPFGATDGGSARNAGGLIEDRVAAIERVIATSTCPHVPCRSVAGVPDQ